MAIECSLASFNVLAEAVGVENSLSSFNVLAEAVGVENSLSSFNVLAMVPMNNAIRVRAAQIIG